MSQLHGAGSGAALHGDKVVLVPVAEAHVPALRRIRATPEVRRRWGEPHGEPEWPFDDPSATLFAVLVQDAVVGMIQFSEENEPDYRHASIDLFIDPQLHNRGIGRDAVRTLARHLVEERGHHRLTIDPAADNQAAIRCYAAVG
ncbi:MAG: GNAT family protein, partial [Candidatus Dormiibacterota bacterium]